MSPYSDLAVVKLQVLLPVLDSNCFCAARSDMSMDRTIVVPGNVCKAPHFRCTGATSVNFLIHKLNKYVGAVHKHQ